MRIGTRSTLIAIAAWICALSLSGTAGAQTAAAKLDQALRLYEEGELSRAEPLLRAAAADHPDPGGRGRAWLYLGLVRASGKDLPATREALRAALSEDPLVELDRARVAPDIVAMFDGLRGELTGELRVEGAEPGAKLFVDGRPLGTLTGPIRVTIGRHALRLLSADETRRFEARDVVVRVREPTRVRVQWAPRFGELTVVGPWTGARVVSEDGQALGVVTESPLRLPAGARRLTFIHTSGHQERRDVVVPPRGQVRVTLPRVTANVTTGDITQPPLVQPAPRPWWRRARTWGFVSLGVGGALALTGALLGRAAQNDADQIKQLRAEDALTETKYRALDESAQSGARNANILFGVAGAAALGGALLVFFDRASGEAPSAAKAPPKTAWRVMPTFGGAALSVTY